MPKNTQSPMHQFDQPVMTQQRIHPGSTIKLLWIFILAALLCSCTTTHPTAGKDSAPAKPSVEAPVIKSETPVPSMKTGSQALFGELLNGVHTSRSSFNPETGEKVVLWFSLTKPCRATVNLYDPDLGLIRSISTKELLKPGEQNIAWNGRDMDGQVVPDEAYFFTIIAEDETGTVEIYDPVTFSGGVEHDITDVLINPEDHTIHYDLPEMGRVMIRMGIHGGPLMHQLVDWEPRVKGSITEYWNGKDRDNLTDLYQNQNFKMLITYFTLPENSVITYGNASINFRDYKRSIQTTRAVKPDRPSSITAVSPHYSLPRTIDYTPDISLDLMNIKDHNADGIPILNKRTIVKVSLDEKDKSVFQQLQFEICFFLDHRFYAEDETGYTPFNWVWNLANVKEGEHTLTVNVSSFQDQIGVKSMKVYVAE